MKAINIVLPDGSMQEPITRLFSKAGLEIIIEKMRTKEWKINVPWIGRVAFQRPQEIQRYVKAGIFDVGITGQEWLANWGNDCPVLGRLPMGRNGNRAVRVVLAVKEGSGIKSVKRLPKNCEVATEYVELARDFLVESGRSDIRVMPSYGNTEQKINLGASAIVDITETGESLRDNGLVIIAEIMKSNTVMIANRESFWSKTKRPYLDCIERLLRGSYQASQYVMLTANVPEKVLNKAVQIVGGLRGPSCSPIIGCKYEGKWLALQSVVRKEKEQEIIFRLLQIRVTDIVVNRDIPLIMSTLGS
jgi:ATP phosphoribosyltransferase